MKRWATTGTAALGFFFASAANAATTIAPGSVGDQTWTPAGSPYLVQGDVTVPVGTTLTIQPGTVVTFADVDAALTGLEPKLVELTVNGSLVATGTKKDPIVFKAAVGAARSSWYGIVLGSNATASLAYDTITSPFIGVRSSTTSSLDFHDVQIGTAGTGVAVFAGSPTLLRLATKDCNVGVRYATAGGGVIAESYLEGSANVAVNPDVSTTTSLTIVNTVITGGGSGVIAKETGAGQTLTVNVTNSTLFNGNQYGIQVSNNAGSTTQVNVLNSIVTSFGNAALIRDTIGTNTFDVTYSDVFANKLNYVNVTPGTGCISVDPQLTSSTDLSLKGTSPCRDTATATGAPATDILGALRPAGAKPDMGAYEFGGVIPACGDGAIQLAETCDDGKLNGTYDHCQSDCSGPGPHCGDGITNGPETCDDANTTNGDGCSSTCMQEPPPPLDAGLEASVDDAGTEEAGVDAGPTDRDGGSGEDSGGTSSSSSSSSSSSGAPAGSADSGLSVGPNVNPTADAPSEDDCSVHAIGASGAGGLWLFAALGALVARRRRRR